MVIVAKFSLLTVVILAVGTIESTVCEGTTTGSNRIMVGRTGSVAFYCIY